MAELLRKGYKMLNLSCPICNNPIFKSKSGAMHCPSCNKPVVFSEDSKITPSINNNDSGEISPQKNIFYGHKAINFLKETIIKKIKYIAKNFNQETNIGLFDNYLNIIKKLLETLHEIKRIEDS